MRDNQIREIVKRVAFLPFFLFLVSFMIFTLARAAPGDPVMIRAGPKADEQTIERIRKELGLDRHFLVQYADYMWGVVRGDFGESILYPDQSVKDMLWPRIKISAPLGYAALVISLTAGTIIGLLAAMKKSWVDSVFINSSIFFYAVPSVILILFMILLFSVKLHFLPASWGGKGWEGLFSKHAIIPVLVLSLPAIAGPARYVRMLCLNVLNQEYVMVAKASGFSFWEVALKHVLRNSLLPLITMIVPAFLFTIIGGAFFVEIIYGIPGIGQYSVEVAFQRDYDVLTALTIMTGFILVVANLLTDVLYTVLDPRVDPSRSA